MYRLLIALILTAAAAFGQTGLLTINNGEINFAGAAHTLPTVVVALPASLPATCTPGELAMVTTWTAGQQIAECGPANVWTQQPGGTVTSVATGCGASGGPITSTGTILGIGVCITVANEAGTGTINAHLAKYTGAPSTAIITGMADTTGAVGVVVSGGGTVGNALIQTQGIATCQFDGFGSVAGHYVIISSTPGRCNDAGASYPTSGEVLGTALQTFAGNSFVLIDLTLRQAVVTSAGAAQIFPFGGGFVNGGSPIAATTISLPVTAAAACTIRAYALSIPKADTGTVTVKFLKIAAGTDSPDITDSINTSGVSLSSGTHVRSTSLGDFTTLAVAAGDVIAVALITVGGAPTGLTANVECQ